jgi:hypothetical protein
MIYDCSNTGPKAQAVDLDTGYVFLNVLEVDAHRMTLTCAAQPLKADGHDMLVVEVIQYRTIYAVQGLEQAPVLFHCIGWAPA